MWEMKDKIFKVTTQEYLWKKTFPNNSKTNRFSKDTQQPRQLLLEMAFLKELKGFQKYPLKVKGKFKTLNIIRKPLLSKYRRICEWEDVISQDESLLYRKRQSTGKHCRHASYRGLMPRFKKKTQKSRPVGGFSGQKPVPPSATKPEDLRPSSSILGVEGEKLFLQSVL